MFVCFPHPSALCHVSSLFNINCLRYRQTDKDRNNIILQAFQELEETTKHNHFLLWHRQGCGGINLKVRARPPSLGLTHMGGKSCCNILLLKIAFSAGQEGKKVPNVSYTKWSYLNGLKIAPLHRRAPKALQTNVVRVKSDRPLYLT